MIRLSAPPATLWPSVSVIVPAYSARDVDACLGAIEHSGIALETILVSDGSPEASHLEAIASTRGVRYLALESNQGPAAARNAGASLAVGDVLLFVDSDAELLPEISELLALFSAPALALAAPRITGAQSGQGPWRSLIGAYESWASPLDMGSTPGEPGVAPPYVPSTCLAVRRAVFESLGGFDENLRYGEDVDFVWRLADKGFVAYYSGRTGALHRNRETPGGLLLQRFRYGTSAAPLARRHPERLTHVIADETTLAMLLWPPLGLGLLALGVWDARRRLLEAASRAGADATLLKSTKSAVVAALGGEITMLARSVGAVTLVVAVGAPALRRRWSLRPATLLLALIALRAESAMERGMTPPRAFGLALFEVGDDLAYSAGLLAGSLREVSIAALVPRFRKGPILARIFGPNQ